MNPTEKLTVEVGLDGAQYEAEAKKLAKENQKLEKELIKTEKQADKLEDTLKKTAQGFVRFVAAIAVSTGILKLATEVAKANDELLFLEKNLNLNARSIKNWQGAASAMGGSAQGMANSMMGLKQSMNSMVMFGDDSMLPYFNALGVNVVSTTGKLRSLDDVFMDIAESLEKMPRDQAYTLAKQMGFDEGTINTLLLGKKELKEMLVIQDRLYKSDKEALEASREFNKQQAIANAQWQALKTMIADAIIPVLTEVIKKAGEFFEFLTKHQKVVKEVFLAGSIIIGMMLIPMLKAGLVALMAFIAPFAPFLITVGALGAAFLALFDDYKVWAEGGKSLFDWTAFTQAVNGAKDAIYQLRDSFLALTKPMYDLFDKSFPNATDKIGQWTASIGAFFGHKPSIDALETNANKEVNGNYNPKYADSGENNADMRQFKQQVDSKIAKAAKAVRRNAAKKSLGDCALYVNNALKKQGISSWGHGKDVAKILINSKQGFRQVKYDKDYKPQVGDVMSIPAGKGQHIKYGHVAMWDGKNWVSDFVQAGRGNTAATNDTSFKNIQKGVSVPTIARYGSPSPANATKPQKSSLSKKDTRMMLYRAAKANGLSDGQAIGLIAEIGRENDFDPNLIFGHHKDPKNGAENIGAISWQGGRAVRLRKFLTAKGFFKNGKMVQSQAALNAQMEFLIKEIKDHYPKVKKGFLDNPNVSEQQSAEFVGRDYIKWAYNNKEYANGHVRRAEYYRQIENEIRMSNISENAAKARQDIAYSGAPSFGGSGMINSNNKTVDVQVAAININTSASTISGNMEEAVKGVQQSYFILEGSSIA